MKRGLVSVISQFLFNFLYSSSSKLKKSVSMILCSVCLCVQYVKTDHTSWTAVSDPSNDLHLTIYCWMGSPVHYPPRSLPQHQTHKRLGSWGLHRGWGGGHRVGHSGSHTPCVHYALISSDHCVWISGTLKPMIYFFYYFFRCGLMVMRHHTSSSVAQWVMPQQRLI